VVGGVDRLIDVPSGIMILGTDGLGFAEVSADPDPIPDPVPEPSPGRLLLLLSLG
jgi:hypothetical protein